MTRQHIHHGAEILLDRGADWRDEAACIGYDYLFFVDDHTNAADVAATDEAKRICKEECTVRRQCLTWAVQRQEGFGVWGGQTTAERGATGVRYCERCHTEPIDLDSRAKYCAGCRPVVRAQRGHNRRRK